MREKRKVLIIETGIANIASVKSMLQKLGADMEVSRDPEAVSAADFAVLPGVGSFGAGIKTLRENGLDQALKERVMKRSATLAICLGLQLFASGSEESAGDNGLGIIDGTVKKFRPGKRVPQLGWNLVTAGPASRYISDGHAYFANSYCLKSSPGGFLPSISNYEEDFIAAFEDKGVLACQFHPELSGQWGLEVVKRWLDSALSAQEEVTCLQNA